MRLEPSAPRHERTGGKVTRPMALYTRPITRDEAVEYVAPHEEAA